MDDLIYRFLYYTGGEVVCVLVALLISSLIERVIDSKRIPFGSHIDKCSETVRGCINAGIFCAILLALTRHL